ncbi:MAG: hypothetical protein QM655_05270 [Nocardioidaceae bacterium]
MNRTFGLGLASLVIGLVVGVGYRLALAHSGSCPNFFSSGSCTSDDRWVAALSLFALATMTGCLILSVLLARHARETEDGYISLGDTLLAIGTIVGIIEAMAYAALGHYQAVLLAALAVVLTMFALKQERHIGVAVAAIMALGAVALAMVDDRVFALGLSPALLWAFGTGAYVASLMSGERIEGQQSGGAHAAW